MHALLGECLGTAFIIIIGGGVVANGLLSRSNGENSGWMTNTTGWFVAVVVGVFIALSVGSPGGDINPAVSFAKYLLGYYPIQTFLSYSAAQLLGAFIGATVVWLAYLPHWRATKNSTNKLAVFSTMPAIRSYPSNLLTECIGTFVLVIGVGAIFGHATLGHPAVGFGPYLVGILVWGIGLSLGGPTGYAINPARDLGPRLAHALLPIAGKGSSDWAYAWVPVIGPLTGAGLAAIAWHWIF
jgi:glycerol uptake facilitator protein